MVQVCGKSESQALNRTPYGSLSSGTPGVKTTTLHFAEEGWAKDINGLHVNGTTQKTT
jgi:hypothetical protein